MRVKPTNEDLENNDKLFTKSDDTRQDNTIDSSTNNDKENKIRQYFSRC